MKMGFLDNDVDIANEFAAFFSSVYQRDTVTHRSPVSLPVLDISCLDICIGDVFEQISALTGRTGPGIDGIPYVFFKSCRFIIARIVWLLYNKSLASGVFPECWKTCVITPVYKSGDRRIVKNYRLISKQSIIPKIFDGLVASK